MKFGLNDLKIGPRLALGCCVTVGLFVLVVTVTVGSPRAGQRGEQTGGLRQINEAVAELDRMTQQNASLVEAGSDASRSLAAQSGGLVGVVSGFRVEPGGRAEKV